MMTSLDPFAVGSLAALLAIAFILALLPGDDEE